MSLYKRFASLTLFTLIVFTLSGCDDFASFNDAPRKVVVEVATPESVKNVERILNRRFNDVLPTIFSSVKSHVKGKTITFIFNRGAPQRDVVEALINRQGELKARTEGGVVWYRTDDIEDVMVSRTDEGNALYIRLSEHAGQTVARLSSNSVGTVLSLDMDGDLLSRARVSEPLGKRFQLLLQLEYQELYLISVMLRSGALPEKVDILSNEL